MPVLLNCFVTPGQFSDEFAVKGSMFDGRGFSLFAQKSDLKLDADPIGFDNPVNGRIIVERIAESENGVLVRLPVETFENGRMVTVAKEQLSRSSE
jgi:hypothetical protein